MNEDARRDLVPALMLFLLSVLFGGSGLFALVNIVSLLPLIFYGLYLLKVIKPRNAYVSKKKRKYKSRYKDIPFYEAMREYPHPILMPRWLYGIVSFFLSLTGMVFFFIPPVSKYFLNWGDIYSGMCSKKLIPIPDLPGKKDFNDQPFEENEIHFDNETGEYAASKVKKNKNRQPDGPSIDEEQIAELAKAVASFVQDSTKNVSELFKEFMASQNGQTETRTQKTNGKFKMPKPPFASSNAASTSQPKEGIWKEKQTKPDPDLVRAQVEAKVIEQIARNDQELRDISKVSVHALDVMFGGSKLTKDKYQASIEEAVELSGKTLQAAKEYVQVGHNPEVLQKFLDRSNMINQKTGELLDALVTHQQSAVEDDVDDLTESLEELQSNLKYYKYK